MSQFNGRFPHYPDDSDYNTNSPSYYDDLAKKSKLIHLLAKRIWEYDEELAKRFAEWDQNLEEFDDEVIRLLNEWLENGVLDDVINAGVLGRKAEIIVSEFEPENIYPTTYWFKDVGESGLSMININSNVAVSDDEPENVDKNVWFDL